MRMKRRRMTESEGRALIEAWRESGLGQREFAERRGVKVARVQYWSRRLALAGPDGDATRDPFLVVTASERELVPSGSEATYIEVVVDDRFVVSVPSTAENLGVLLRVMMEARR